MEKNIKLPLNLLDLLPTNVDDLEEMDIVCNRLGKKYRLIYQNNEFLWMRVEE